MMSSLLFSNNSLVRECGQFFKIKSTTLSLPFLLIKCIIIKILLDFREVKNFMYYIILLLLPCIEPDVKVLEGRKVDVDVLLKIIAE